MRVVVGRAPSWLGFATFPPPMFSVATDPHFVGQFLWVEAQELRQRNDPTLLLMRLRTAGE